ncbi:MAG: xanthine dehydrogenase family protein molybdopterin-binding subunit [Pseudomonadota bacterium]|nr:xanthine dehydrogenase family protein molybdopterin-binding subunit [Pseudomonadota bacterium]
MSLPNDVELTRPQYVGATVTRREDPRLLSGEGNYVADIKRHGMLHIAFRRSDQAHALIHKIDIGEVLSLPGVIGVYTGKDIAEIAKPYKATSRMKNYQATYIPPLAIDKVRYVGEAVVAVVAESRYIAEDALGLIEVEYRPLPVLVDPEKALEPEAPKLHEQLGSNVLAEREFARGEVTEVFVNAPVTVGGRFHFTRTTPVTLETRAAVAEYDKGAKSLTLHSTTQIPGIVRDKLSEIFDLPGPRVRVIAPDVGGGFGGKTSLYSEEIVASAISRALGKPIKWVSDRMEDLMTTGHAFDEVVYADIAVTKDGEIVGLKADVIGDVGAYSIYPWTATIEPVQVVSFMPGPYRIENYSARVRAVATNKTLTGAYRGVGRPISVFVMDRLLDMAARKIGMDPAEIRRRNLVNDDEFPYKAASGLVWDKSAFQSCLREARDKIGYEELRREQNLARAEGRWVGVGIASYAELTGVGSRIAVAPGMPINTGTETCNVAIDSTGAVTASFGIASQGQGMETTLAQVVAQELGVKLEDVEIILGDTAAVSHSTGTYASRGAVFGGGAGTLAAQAVREKIIRVAGHLLEAAEEDIEVGDGNVWVKGTDSKMTIRDLARALYSNMGSVPKEMRDEIDNLEATKVYDPFFGTTTAATHMCLVEVDPETYNAKIKKYIVVEDCGKVINPMIANGQAHGGVAQGIGVALMEEVIHDDTGQVLTASLVDYVVPSAVEVPSMDVMHVEAELPGTIGGFRGLGEGGTIGAPACIANAISDALSPLGVEIMELPATPERLFRLIEAAKSL